MKEQAKFWDWIATRYSSQPIADEPAYEEKLRRTRLYFDTDCRVLEFGSGTGSTAIAHAPYVGHIHATDISENMLAIGSEKARQVGLGNISFELASLSDLDSITESYDAVLGMSVLHLLPNLRGDMERVYSMLKPGGVFVSSSPCIADMSSLFRFFAPLFRWLPFLPSISVFSREELAAAMESVGFAIEDSWQPDKDKALFVVARK